MIPGRLAQAAGWYGGVAHSEWYAFEDLEDKGCGGDSDCLVRLMCCVTGPLFILRITLFLLSDTLLFMTFKHIRKCDRILEKRINIALKHPPISWLLPASQSILIRGKYFVHTHKWAPLIIARFYAQFKFKSFLLDTANTSVTRLLVPSFFFFFFFVE